MIGNVEYGGCVLAKNEPEAQEKLRKHYGNEEKITVWMDNDIALDIVEVYP